MTEIDYKIKEKFANKIIQKIKTKITGSDSNITYDERPSSQFFVGTLCTQEQDSLKTNFVTMVKPFTMGAEFLISKEDAKKSTLYIKPDAAFYYRIFPSYEKQIEFMKNNFNQTYPEKDFFEYLKSQNEDEQLPEKLLKTYKKINFPNLNLKLDLQNIKDKDEGDFNTEISAEVDKLLDEIQKDPLLFHSMKHTGDETYKEREANESILLGDIVDKETFEKKLQDWSNKAAIPNWKFNIYYSITDFSNENWKIKVIFVNECVNASGDSIENYIFESKLTLNLEGGSFNDFIFDYLKDNYKYDGNVNTSGINCSAILINPQTITTEHLPIYIQPKKITNNELIAKFEDLEKTPLEVLKNLLNHMQDELNNMKLKKHTFLKTGEEIKMLKYEYDLKQFQNEILRFQKGINVLEKYPKVLESFKLMNKSFMKSTKGYDSWRLFQIVFIVMNIPDIAKSEYSEIEANQELVDVIYFPTGGGKTEAYLGLVVMTAFFDRLRGKFAGVTAITKFPLRLLSLQQLQRIADIFAKAELVRREHPEINTEKNEPFSMGYYVGKGNTPNILIKKDNWGSDEDNLSPLIEHESEREKLLIISKCPFCESKDYKVKIEADIENVRIKHVCTNPECSENELPIYISDIEVYRYIPTFIISTLDKIPTCGFQRNFRNIFGQVNKKCPKHGYMSGEQCIEINAGCSIPKEEYETVELYDPTPTLQIQDEMHLIKESFGSFDSHYETYLINLQKKLSNKPLKIITATATINDDFHLQVKHLYGREETVKFPSSGPDRKKSFYSMDDPDGRISRIIVGLLPHNKTIRFSVIDIIKYFAQIIKNYWNNPTELLNDEELGLKSIDEVKFLLKEYTTILEYNLAKKDGSAINQSIPTMINPFLRKINSSSKENQDLSFVSMTGDVRFKDVRAILDKLENFKEKPDIDLITATSMISHGVDIDSLNFMVFHGMPGNTAEYVQAYSRIGRKHPGIVFIILNPTKEREQSYYKYFNKFHEFQDLLVESVPINRWAKFSVNRTLPGIFTSSLMHYFDLREGCTRLDMTKGFQEAYQNAKITTQEITDFLIESYKTTEDDLGNNFKIVIEKRIGQYIDQIIQSRNNKFIPMFLSDSPMTSLRDIDEQIDIKVTPESAPAMSKISKKINIEGDQK